MYDIIQNNYMKKTEIVMGEKRGENLKHFRSDMNVQTREPDGILRRGIKKMQINAQRKISSH